MTNDILQNKKHPIRLLLVEDNRGDALLVKRAFARTEVKNHITIAKTGEEALNLLYHDESPDLILLDLNLPGINGLEVLRTIKNDDRFKHIPVIVLSSSRADHDVLNSYNNHANCYMKKAASLDELYELANKIEQFWFKHVILPHDDHRKYNVPNQTT